MPGAARAITPRRSPTTTCRSRPIQNRRTRARTAASRRRRSANSTARWPTSTRRSGSTRQLPPPLINRAAIWRVKGDYDRAIADSSEAIRLAKDAALNVMTPPNSVLISGYTHRALPIRRKAITRARASDYTATLADHGFRCRQQGQSGHRKGPAVAHCRRPQRRIRRSSTAAPTAAPLPPRRRPLPCSVGKRMALVIGNGAYTHAGAAQSAQ